MQSMSTGLSALNAASSWLNQISDNLANQNTVGFAADQGSFADTLTAHLSGSATAPTVAPRDTPLGWWGGTGVLNVGEGHNFSQMPLQKTDNPLDVAIQGSAFFQVQGPNNTTLYTKAGNFQWSKRADGKFELAMPNGMPVLDMNGQPILQPASGAANMSIGSNGQISYGTTRGQTIAMAHVPLPGTNLTAQGNNTYSLNAAVKATPASASTMSQGYLAMSNVDMTKEMVDMITAQRMFDLNSESIQLTGRMDGIANNIHP